MRWRRSAGSTTAGLTRPSRPARSTATPRTRTSSSFSATSSGRTLPQWKHRNLLGDVRALPFDDHAFDFAYDTCLCYLPEEDLDKAIAELFRVTRTGVFFGGITSDMTRDVIEEHELFRGVQSLMTTAEWSERFLKHGFRVAIVDEKVLRKAWSIECASNEGASPWYPDMRALRSCFFTKPPAARELHPPAVEAAAKGPTFPRDRSIPWLVDSVR